VHHLCAARCVPALPPACIAPDSCDPAVHLLPAPPGPLPALCQVPVIQHSESERDKVWSKVHSEDTAEEVIPVITAWQLNERM